jgi:hypothetical protein
MWALCWSKAEIHLRRKLESFFPEFAQRSDYCSITWASFSVSYVWFKITGGAGMRSWELIDWWKFELKQLKTISVSCLVEQKRLFQFHFSRIVPYWTNVYAFKSSSFSERPFFLLQLQVYGQSPKWFNSLASCGQEKCAFDVRRDCALTDPSLWLHSQEILQYFQLNDDNKGPRSNIQSSCLYFDRISSSWDPGIRSK